MSNAEQSAPASGQRNWQSVRTVLEALILTAIIVLYQSMSEQAKFATRMDVQMSAVRDDMSNLRVQLNDVPQIARGMAKIEVRLDEHERRLNELEQVRRLR
jgi:hypothetical protein